MGKTRGRLSGTSTTGTTKKPRKIRADGRIKSAYWIHHEKLRLLRLVAADQDTDSGTVIDDALEAYLSKFNVVKGLRRENAAEAEAKKAAAEAEAARKAEADLAGVGEGVGTSTESRSPGIESAGNLGAPADQSV